MCQMAICWLTGIFFKQTSILLDIGTILQCEKLVVLPGNPDCTSMHSTLEISSMDLGIHNIKYSKYWSFSGVKCTWNAP